MVPINFTVMATFNLKIQNRFSLPYLIALDREYMEG